jgi:hypothetical protein
LSNVDIHLEGNLHLPRDIPTVQAIGESGVVVVVLLTPVELVIAHPDPSRGRDFSPLSGTTVNATGQAWLSGVWISLQGENVGWYGSKNVSNGWIYGKYQARVVHIPSFPPLKLILAPPLTTQVTGKNGGTRTSSVTPPEPVF